MLPLEDSWKLELVKKHGKQYFKAGFYNINRSQEFPSNKPNNTFSQIELFLLDGEVYDYQLVVPYPSPAFDVKTSIKIFDNNTSAESEIEELIITACC